MVRLAYQLLDLEKYLDAYSHRDQSGLASEADPVVVAAVGSADRGVQVESHKVERVRGEILDQVEGTSLVELRKAFQGIQDQEDHLDPNCQAEEDRMEGTQDVDRKEGQEDQEEGHVVVVVVASPELVDAVLEGLVEQKGAVGLHVETFE